MYLNNLFSKEINGVSTDFKPEVIAVEMIENNTPADRILIIPLGALKRSHSKDIESIAEELSAYDNKEYFIIKTHKEGLYDKLPEALFHQPISYITDKTAPQVIEAIKRHRLEEKAARNFFLPFDTALNHIRIEIATYENQLDKKFNFDQLVNIFASDWEIFKYLNVLQANIFLQFLPIFHQIRDDWDAIENLLELMLLMPVKLALRNQRKRMSLDEHISTKRGLGLGMLGVNLITGDYMEGDNFVEMVITLGPITAEQAAKFSGSEQQEKIVLMLCDYVLPADIDIVIAYDFVQHDRHFVLNDKGTIGTNCEMGVSTFL